MVIAIRRLKAGLRKRADDYSFHPPASPCPRLDFRSRAAMTTRTLIESYDQQSVTPRLKVGTGQQRSDFGLQPVIELEEPRPIAVVVRVIAQIRSQKRQAGEGIVTQVRGELAEADAVGLVDVGKIRQR